MVEYETDVQTADGVMNAYIVHPDEGGPHPVVLFLMDAPGKRPELHDMASRLASAGYYVMLPNLYYRRVRAFDIASSDRETMFGHMNSLSNALVCADADRLLAFADADANAADGPAGCVGYCMSGPFAFALAAHSERIRAAASFHGVRLYTNAADSPHLGTDRIRGELYFGCAAHDEWAPPEMIADLDKHLATTDVRYRIEWYPGTHHGFVFPRREGLYHRSSAERHWERLHALFRRNLVAD